ncbi:DUF6497 family protein [Neotabrizicola sp. sgz301269]|uniref:DUF6497 family protein n=1 Tax=Neotabrizicola sp. sgz301269 TaxID=3276282 RepID=UPI0037701A64
MLPIRRLAAACACTLLLAGASCDEDAPGAAAGGEAVAVPSGRAVTLLDVIMNAPGVEGAAARFRFIVPDLKAGEADAWADDMLALCQDYALPRVRDNVPAPSQIIISLSDRAVPFGEAAPEAVQFFEAYAPKGDACIWEMF